VTLSEASLLLLLGALLRIGAFVAVAPPFSSQQIPVSVRVGLSLAMALPAAHLLAVPSGTFSNPNSTLIFLVVQVVLGLALGVLVNTLISAFSSAGFLSGLLGGFSPPPQLDPLSLNQNSGLGILYEMIALMLLFTSGAYLFILKGLFVSLKIAMPTHISSSAISQLVINNFSTFFGATLQIAAPIAAVAFTVQILLSILSKVSPSISIYALSFPIQILATILVVSLVISNLPGFVQLISGDSVTTMMNFMRLINGG
ncbi:unnamed protein product, partial [Acidithrix sp. C25]